METYLGNRFRPLQKIIKCRVVEPDPNSYIYKPTPEPKAERTLWKGNGKSLRTRASGSLLWVMSPSNTRSYSCNISPTWSPKHEVNRDGMNEHAKLEREYPGGLNPTKRKTGSWAKWERKWCSSSETSTPTGGLVPNSQPWKHIQEHYTDWTGFVLEYMCIYKYIHACNNS